MEPLYRISFKVEYKTAIGESLCVVGNIPELYQYKAHMTWTDGHVWVLEDVPVYVPFFQYKYVVLDKGNPVRKEVGFDRICDLQLLQAQNKDLSSLVMHDHFDRFTVNFSMHYPIEEGEIMRINGDTAELGHWNEAGGPK